MANHFVQLELGAELANYLEESEIRRELRVSGTAVIDMAVFVLEQQPGTVLPPRSLVSNRWNSALNRQKMFNERHQIPTSFEQTGRLIERGVRAADFMLEQEGITPPLVMPDEFLDLHPAHLSRISRYFLNTDN